MESQDNEVRPVALVELAPEVALARVARAAAAACCAIAGFSIDRVADVRLVVDEVFNVLVVVGVGPVRLRLIPTEDSVDLEMSAARRDDRGWRVDELGVVRLLTDVTADQATFEDRDGRLVMDARFGAAPV